MVITFIPAWCFRFPTYTVVFISSIFDNTFGIENDFTILIEGAFLVMFRLTFSINYFSNYASVYIRFQRNCLAAFNVNGFAQHLTWLICNLGCFAEKDIHMFLYFDFVPKLRNLEVEKAHFFLIFNKKIGMNKMVLKLERSKIIPLSAYWLAFHICDIYSHWFMLVDRGSVWNHHFHSVFLPMSLYLPLTGLELLTLPHSKTFQTIYALCTLNGQIKAGYRENWDR